MDFNTRIQCFADDMDFFMYEDENVQGVNNSLKVYFATFSAKVSRFVAMILWYVTQMLCNICKVGLLAFTVFVLYHFETYGEVNFTIPFTDIYVELDWVLKSLISWSFFDLGPINVFISPFFLCPFRLPDCLPFTQSFVALKLWDFPVPLTGLLVNLHMLPYLNLNVPSLTGLLSSSSRPRFTVDLSLMSVFSPLWSLLTLRLSYFGLRLALLPITECKIGMTIFNLNTSESTQAERLETDDRQRLGVMLYIAKVVLTLYCSVTLYQFVTNGGADFLIPFTDITMDLAWLLESLPLSKMFIHVGPVTVFISPLSFSPFPLPDFMPFRQSFVCLKLWDFPVPLEELFINLHVLPTLYVYLPSLSSFSLSPQSLPNFPVSLSLISLSTVFHPVEVIGAQLICPLWSLLTLRLSNVRLRMRLFPGHRQMPKPLASSVMSAETFVDTEDTHTDIMEVELLDEYRKCLDTHLLSDKFHGACITMAWSTQDHLITSLIGMWVLAIRAARY